MQFKARGVGEFIWTDGSNDEYARMSAVGVEIQSDDAYYLGDENVDGTWRFVRNGTDLQVELRESGTYNSKGSFTP